MAPIRACAGEGPSEAKPKSVHTLGSRPRAVVLLIAWSPGGGGGRWGWGAGSIGIPPPDVSPPGVPAGMHAPHTAPTPSSPGTRAPIPSPPLHFLVSPQRRVPFHLLPSCRLPLPPPLPSSPSLLHYPLLHSLSSAAPPPRLLPPSPSFHHPGKAELGRAVGPSLPEFAGTSRARSRRFFGKLLSGWRWDGGGEPVVRLPAR